MERLGVERVGFLRWISQLWIQLCFVCVFHRIELKHIQSYFWLFFVCSGLAKTVELTYLVLFVCLTVWHKDSLCVLSSFVCVLGNVLSNFL